MKKDIRIWSRTLPVIRDGRWVKQIDAIEVRVMAIAEGYAMVRVSGAMPFVAALKTLSPKAAA